jgi:hypothetical protein
VDDGATGIIGRRDSEQARATRESAVDQDRVELQGDEVGGLRAQRRGAATGKKDGAKERVWCRW